MSVTLFLDDINICNSRLSKTDSPPQCGRVSCNLLEAWINERLNKKDFFLSVCLNWDNGSSLVFRLGLELTWPALLIPRPSGSEWKYSIDPPGCPAWPTAVLDFLVSTTAWTNYYRKSVSPIGSVFLDNTDSY